MISASPIYLLPVLINQRQNRQHTQGGEDHSSTMSLATTSTPCMLSSP